MYMLEKSKKIILGGSKRTNFVFLILLLLEFNIKYLVHEFQDCFLGFQHNCH